MHEAAALPLAAQHYLEQLRLESATLPAADRQQLLSQIGEHLSESIDEGSDVSAVLDRLGSPRELVAAAGADEVTPPQWRPSALLWVAIAGVAAGLLLLLWGGNLMLFTGRGRGLLLAIPGLLLAVAGIVLTLRELRWRHDDPAAAAAKRRILRWLAIAALVAGSLLLVLSVIMFMSTGRGRSLMLVLPGAVLAIAGAIAAVRWTSRSPRREV